VKLKNLIKIVSFGKCNPLVRTSVGSYLFFFVIVRFRYLKIKNSKNHLGLVFLFLKDVQICSNIGFRNPKRGGYEVRVGLRVCD
jgi:hypothetical protein